MTKVFTTITEKQLSREQKVAIRDTYTIDKIVSIPYPAYIDPNMTMKQLETLACDYADKLPPSTVLVLVGGEDFTFVLTLVRELQSRGVDVIYETFETIDNSAMTNTISPAYETRKHASFRILPNVVDYDSDK